jgi:hypothetical protein
MNNEIASERSEEAFFGFPKRQKENAVIFGRAL